MSFESDFNQLVTVHVRTAQADTWTQVGGSFRASIEPLTESGRRATMMMLDPSATHVLRCRPHTSIKAGRRVRTAAGEEYEVRTVRDHRRRGQGEMVVNLAAMEAV
ncbi:MAG: head-tail adaptor protein [Veillonellaceae bacterium]|nr:head-tail adaptor protein [Veillonellaceae bacterium]